VANIEKQSFEIVLINIGKGNELPASIESTYCASRLEVTKLVGGQDMDSKGNGKENFLFQMVRALESGLSNPIVSYFHLQVCDFGLSRFKGNTFLSSRSAAGTVTQKIILQNIHKSNFYIVLFIDCLEMFQIKGTRLMIDFEKL
jgi:hypothetical protein